MRHYRKYRRHGRHVYDKFRDFTASPNTQNFQRSNEDRVWAGVCGGIAERYGWDSLAVRLAAIAGTLLGMAPFVIVGYIALWMLTPERRGPRMDEPTNEEEAAFWSDVSRNPRATFSNLKYTFRDLEDRLSKMETNVTSNEWQLRKEFRDLERD